MAEKSHMTIFSQSKYLNFSVAQIYAGIFFIGQGPGHFKTWLSIRKIK